MSQIQKSHEDYIKAIYLISKENKGGWASNSKISKFLKVKPPSVTNMLHKLKANGLIDWRPKKSIRLTKKGKEIALNIVKNYNCLFDFFIHVLKVKNESTVQKLCCEIEHYMSKDVSDALENLVLELC